MSQTLLFSVGVGVFAITLVATLLYGYFALDRVYQADAAERPVLDEPAARTGAGIDDRPARPVVPAVAIAE